ncbi:MAG TPA: hypothetical protein VNZ49_04990 [Bacteroidia bacterium]|jgi:hypothetical protein|nr:hypothetical protein [Bacteroidia bacterium]
MAQDYDVLICYDINSKHDAVHTAVKNCMLAKGYADRLTYPPTGKVTYLPNTTLWKQKREVDVAKTDLEDCLTEFNKKNSTNHFIERFIALEFTSIWQSLLGQPHTSISKSPDKY